MEDTCSMKQLWVWQKQSNINHIIFMVHTEFGVLLLSCYAAFSATLTI